MEETEQSIVHEGETGKNNTEKFFMWFGSLILLFGIIIILFIGFTNPSFTTGRIVLTLLALLIISLIIIFFFKIKESLQKRLSKTLSETRIPEPVSKDYIIEKLKYESLKNTEFFNEVKKINKSETYNKGNNLIYAFDIDVLYPDNNGNERYFVIYNANYPSRSPTILPNPSDTKIKYSVNYISDNPDPPEQERRETIFHPTGAIAEKYSKGVKKEENKKEKKKEGDLE